VAVAEAARAQLPGAHAGGALRRAGSAAAAWRPPALSEWQRRAAASQRRPGGAAGGARAGRPLLRALLPPARCRRRGCPPGRWGTARWRPLARPAPWTPCASQWSPPMSACSTRCWACPLQPRTSRCRT
jgi:hypothetical protein